MSLRKVAAWAALATVLVGSSTLALAQDELPQGHPSVTGGGGSPHGHAGAAGGASASGVFEPPSDSEVEDASLPPGAIEVDLRDADDKPVPHEAITLGILVNSVAKGDSRQHIERTTGDDGKTVFSQLDLASNIAYRVSCGYQGGLFAATPFQLSKAKAMRVVLHVYPVTGDLQKALIVTEATIAAEVREDRIQIEEALTFYNLGRIAWRPDNMTMHLPDGYAALNAQASMTDQGVDESDGGASLHGTFPPGRSSIQFRWQLPWSEDRDVDFEMGLPPHVAIARVMMPAAPGLKLVAAGFPSAEVRHDSQGQSFLVTERRMRPDDAKLASITVGIHDLPTPGSGRLIAMALAACGVASGLAFAFGYAPNPSDKAGGTRAKRAALLDELAELERARAVGAVGPKTYERSRREIMDSLSRLLALG